MGLEILNIVADHIEKAATAGKKVWNQDSWGQIDSESAIRLFGNDKTPSRQEVINECGTTACIAGWTVLLAGDPRRVRFRKDLYDTYVIQVEPDPDTEAYYSTVEEYARELLGLDSDETQFLFSSDWRPDNYNHDLPDTSPENMKAVARKLRHYAANGILVQY